MTTDHQGFVSAMSSRTIERFVFHSYVCILPFIFCSRNCQILLFRRNSCDTAACLHRSALCSAAAPAPDVITGGLDSRRKPLVAESHRPDWGSSLKFIKRDSWWWTRGCRGLVERPSAGETLPQLCDICWAGFSCSFVDLCRHWPFLCLHSHTANANPLVIFLFPPPFLHAAECSPQK